MEPSVAALYGGQIHGKLTKGQTEPRFLLFTPHCLPVPIILPVFNLSFWPEMPQNGDWRSLYPFASHELRLDGHRYHYVDEGQGETLLLVHGNPTWSFYWRELIQAWRGQYRVVAPDHIGCGLSDKPQQYAYRLAQHVDNLNRLIETLDLQPSHAAGPGLGRRDRLGSSSGRAGAIRAHCVVQHGGLSLAADAAADSRLSHACAGTAWPCKG